LPYVQRSDPILTEIAEENEREDDVVRSNEDDKDNNTDIVFDDTNEENVSHISDELS